MDSSLEKPSEELKTRNAEMERSALKAMVDMVEVSQPYPPLVAATSCSYSVWTYRTAAVTHTGRGRKTNSPGDSLSPTCRVT